MNHKRSMGLLLALMVLLTSTHVAWGQTGMRLTLDKVDIQSVAKLDTLTAGSEAQFAVTMDIDEGWHLNAHNPTLDYLIGVDLAVDASEHGIVSDIRIQNQHRRSFHSRRTYWMCMKAPRLFW